MTLPRIASQPARHDAQLDAAAHVARVAGAPRLTLLAAWMARE